MADPLDGQRENRGVAGFLARWGTLYSGEAEPCAVLWADTLAAAFLNDAGRASVGRLTTPTGLLPPGAMGAIREQGVWRGATRVGDARWATTALAIAGAGGGLEGVALIWSPPSAPIPPGSLVPPEPSTLRRVLDLSADLVIGVDEAGRIVYRSEVARGFFPREILGLRAQDALQGAALRALRGEEPAPEETVDARGQRRVLRWRGLPLDGTRAAVAIGRDVTDEQAGAIRLKNRVQRLEAMHAISLALGRGEPLTALYALAFGRLAEVVPLRQGALHAVSGDLERPQDARLNGLFAWDRGEGRLLDEAVTLASHPALEAVRAGEPVQLPTSGPAALTWTQLRTASRMGLHAVLALPLRDEGRVFGVLWLATARPAGFSPDDVEAAGEVAGLLANAMVRQRLLDRIAGYTRELEARVEASTSELRSTQAQLIQAARLSSIGELSSGLAHELNQPLNVLSGYIELLTEGDLSAEEARKALDVMGKASERMAVLVRHLRDFSRAGVETLRGLDLRQVLDMARELTVRATRRLVTVRWERPPTPIPVLGDPGRLEQLFINLIANAMQATEANGGHEVLVRVGTSAHEDVIIEVCDGGQGVPAALRGRIFEPFFTTKERGAGTGLGLSISAKIASEHQGRIEVDDGPGGGAIFRVVLPRYDLPPQDSRVSRE